MSEQLSTVADRPAGDVRTAVIARCVALRIQRDRAGLLQASLARMVGIDVSHLSAIENGHVDPLLSTYLALRGALTAGGCLQANPYIWQKAAQRQALAWAEQAGAERRRQRIAKVAFERVGIAARQLDRVEKAECIAKLSTALRIAEVVGVDV